MSTRMTFYYCCLLWSIAANTVLATPLKARESRRAARRVPTLEDTTTCTMPPKELTVPARQFSFDDEDGHSIEIEWLGKNGKTKVVMCTNGKFGQDLPSSLWRSTDSGLYYSNDTYKLNNSIILSSSGTLKSPSDPNRAILVVATPLGANSQILSTLDAGFTWRKIDLPFLAIKFLMHPSRPDLILSSSFLNTDNHKKNLYLSKDFGTTWNKIINDVYSYAWGSTGDKEETIYASYGSVKDRRDSKLVRSDDLAKTWEVILPRLQHFLVSSKFVFASIVRKGTQSIRDLFVSERSGKVNSWFKARIPFALTAGSYYILDTHDKMAFVHWDMAGKGVGTLYASDTQGINYATSLSNHVHHRSNTDFYVVKSIRATYITTVTDSGNPNSNLQSRITFNRGGRWHPLRTTECDSSRSDSGCSFHVHGVLSIHNKKSLRHVSGPLSVKGAHGLVLAHGMAGKYVDSSKADVYVSTNGGYLWKKALSGIHQYTIGDWGKLIVAVPLTTSDNLQDTLYYSENYGQCWHSSKFSTVRWKFTGILADPVTNGMQVTLWGFTPQDGVWQTVTMEFEDVVERKCTDADLETYVPHLENRDHDDEKMEGCLLGKKESMKVVKADRWCRRSASHEADVITEPCSCSRADFECDYGYVLVPSNGSCVVDKDLPHNISRAMECEKGQTHYMKSTGYRHLPADECKGGEADKYGNLQKTPCQGYAETIEGAEATPSPPKKKSYAGTVVIVLVATIVFLGGVYVYFKRRDVCVPGRHKGTARYSRVRTVQSSSSSSSEDDAPLLDVSGPKSRRSAPAQTTTTTDTTTVPTVTDAVEPSSSAIASSD